MQSRHGRRTLLGTALFMLPALQAGGQGSAWPSRPEKSVVPFAAGSGAASTIARLVSEHLSTALRQPFVVENRGGASGAIGTQAVAMAAPDGYTILLADRGVLGLLPGLNPKLGYDPLKAFVHVGIIAEIPYVLGVRAASATRSLADFVALARQGDNKLNYGSFGVGSLAHLNFEVMSARLGLKIQHVPYKTVSEAVAALVAGEVDITMGGPPATLGFVRDGRMRAIAISGAKRDPLLPAVPTIGESGFPEDLVASSFFALAVPAGTAESIVARLHAAMESVAADAAVMAKLAALGFSWVGGTGAVERDIIASDLVLFGDVIRRLGITAE